jgi:hypothetical protein
MMTIMTGLFCMQSACHSFILFSIVTVHKHYTEIFTFLPVQSVKLKNSLTSPKMKYKCTKESEEWSGTIFMKQFAL